MKIIAHRGFWLNYQDRNTLKSFSEAFLNGFGVETDIRDCLGELVISHDPAMSNCLKVKDFFQLYRSFMKEHLMLALNVKADGLQEMLIHLLDEYNINNYFVFDMSFPDLLAYKNAKIKSFTRQSDIEKVGFFCEEVDGIWIDCFKNDWNDFVALKKYLCEGKKVCVVSPELHKREYMRLWQKIKAEKLDQYDEFILCTDYPAEAKRYFFYE